MVYTYAKICAGIVAANIMATPEYIATKSDCAYRQVQSPVHLNHLHQGGGTFTPPAKPALPMQEALDEKLRELREEAKARALALYPLKVQMDVALGANDALLPSDPLHPDNVKAGLRAIAEAARLAEEQVLSLSTSSEVRDYKVQVP